MAFKYREEIVGKRFLAVRSPGKLKLTKICDWDWRAGIIRAVSLKNSTLPDLQVLVEFDDRDWQRREWIRIYDIFTVFLVENSLVWTQRNHPYKTKSQKIWWPALNYTALVDLVGIHTSKQQPVECLLDAKLEYVEEGDTRPFKDDLASLPGPAKDLPEVKTAVREWTEYQDGQSILLTTPSVLVGERVRVYRAEGTTQWYTAVIKSYNDTTKELNIVDDTVLEEHNEDPAIIQMILLGDGVVDSILRGIDVGSTPRITRRACTNKDKEKEQNQGHYGNRPRAQSPTHTTPQPKQVPNRKPRQKPAVPEVQPEIVEKPREKSPEKVVKPSRSARDRKRKVEPTKEPSPAVTTKKVKPQDKSPVAVVALDDIALREPLTKSKPKEKRERKPRSAVVKKEPEEPKLETPETPETIQEEVVESVPVAEKEVKKNKRSRSAAKQPAKVVEKEVVKEEKKKKHTAKEPAAEKSVVKEKKPRRKKKKAIEESEKQNEHLDSAEGDISGQSDDMHYKKIHLLGAEKEEKQKATNLSASINVNHSVTDQIAKLSGVRADKIYDNNDSNQSAASTTVYNNESAGSIESCPTPQNLHKASEMLQQQIKREENISLSSDESERIQRHIVDVKKTSPKTSSSSSPLIVDKNEQVEVWRDPDLIKKDAEARQQIASLQQHQQQASTILPRRMTPTTTQQAASYPSSVHTPIPHGIPSVGQQSQHPITVGSRILAPIPYPVTMGAAGLNPHMLPHHAATSSLAALNAFANDPLAAARQQQLQLQYHHMLQEQQRLSATYQLHPNVTAAQLELLWQQKYPSIPLPPAWMLAQFQDELLRDMNILRERELLERERHERERVDRERKERERLEREKVEKDRLERERVERERTERERQEKDRQERERIVQEQERRRERERIIRESKSADLAVNQHFTESLRLASQKAQTSGTWKPSITLGMPKQPSSSANTEQARNLTKTSAEKTRDQNQKELEEKLKQERDREQLRRQQHYELEKKFQEAFHKDVLMQTQESLMLKQNEEKQKLQLQQEELLKQFQIRQHKVLQEHLAKTDPKLAEQIVKQGLHPYFYPQGSTASSTLAAYASNATSASGQNIKQETPSFSLYGYQPYQHTFVSQEKLLLHGLEKPGAREPQDYSKESSADSKNLHQGSVVSDKKRGLTSPPPLIKDGHSAHKSVIVENRNREANTKHRSIGEGGPPRPLSPQSQYKLLLQQHYPGYARPDLKSSRTTQSPLRVASPQHITQAIMQPLELQKAAAAAKSAAEKSGGSSAATSAAAAKMVYSASQYLATIAQPPVSLPANALIQQGLIPKPEYSHTSAMNSTKVSNSHDGRSSMADVVSNNSSLSALATMTPPGMRDHSAKKRSGNVKDPKGGKKVKTEEQLSPALSSSSCSSNPSSAPYSQSGSSAVTASSTAAALLIPGLSSSGKAPGGFMDSFRSFVESTVQNAFYQETELEKAANHPKNRHKGLQPNVAPLPPSLQQTQQAQTQQQLQQQPQPQQQNTLPNPAHTPTSQPAPSRASCSSSSSDVERMDSRLAPFGVASIVDTINRVANGIIDTDSDTLSAPSPPPHIRNGDVTLSPNKSGNQMKLKKAWLQRHSGEDQEKTSCGSVSSAESPTIKCEPSKDDNFGRVSPLKDEDSKSMSSPSLSNGNSKDVFSSRQAKDHDSTSSASETESQGSTGSNPVKRRVKSRRKHPESKKSKAATDASASETTTNRKKLTASRKGKDVKEEVSGDGVVSKKGLDRIIDLKNEDSRSSISDSETKERRKPSRKGKEAVKQEPGVVSKDVKPVFNINKPLNKLPAAKLKKSMEPFLQDGPCAEVTPKLMKCRECKMTPNQRSKKMPNIFCRFYAFRRLRYSQKGFIMLAGFSESSDAETDDIQPWMPHYPVSEPSLDVEAAKYIVKHVGDQFCELVEQEKEVISWNKEDGIIAWKRAVQGVREMCDVCDTTLFNMHWVCHKCGFVVCLDCYRVKKDKPVSEYDLEDSVKEGDKDEHHWLKCSANRQPHEACKLMLTQIIPAESLWEVGDLIHDIRKKWSIKARCPCGKSNDLPELKAVPKNGINTLVNGDGGHYGKMKRMNNASYPENINANVNGLGNKGFDDPLSLLADVASMDSRDKSTEHIQAMNKVKEYPFQDTKALTSSTHSIAFTNSATSSNRNGSIFDIDTIDADKKGSGCATLRELLTKKSSQQNAENNKKARIKARSLEEIIQTVVEKDLPRDQATQQQQEQRIQVKLIHYVPRSGTHMVGRMEPVPSHTLTETSVLFPDVPHSWLCEGRLLRLHDPTHKNNLPLFQQQWKLGQPVLVSNVTSKMKLKELWMPDTFSKEFGHLENDLVNCKNGVVLIGHDMRDFWEGFESMAKRVTDEETDEPLILKLKDWPPGEDFSELLPTRFHDLMQALPLPEYTHRQGRLNLAARLPDFFVKPDLGPKMYNAYGMASHPKEASTNLHLDISDAVNVMVHVGIPLENRAEQEAAALKAIDDVGCDIITRRRVRESGEVPGALWHIYDAHDADKIRDLLNKNAKERGEEIEPDHDPIHDQSWYLDDGLQERLLREYGVQGYQIVQCAGDAIFIPAGAPHQVRNLHSCIKVAEDFVSPEHLSHCFRMTQEFRLLSNTHSNHEDKLQVKNIIFHAVKDAVAVLDANDPKTTKDLDY